MTDEMLCRRMEFIHAEFRDWFRSKAPERYRTLAIILHDGIRERIGEILGSELGPLAGTELVVAVKRAILESIDAEFAAATGFEFEAVEPKA